MVELSNIRYPALDSTPRMPPREPQHGAVSPLAHHWRPFPRTRREVIAGFRSQELRMLLNGQRVVFTASAECDPSPFTRPVLVLSATIHDYTRKDPGVPHLPAVALAADRQWLDRLCVVDDDVAGWRAAAELGGRFVVRWSESGAELIDLADGCVIDRWGMQGRTIVHRCCPIIPDARPGDQCTLHGGPWVSSSMVASMHWNDRRARFLSEVGCDEACEHRPRRQPGAVPTRYDTWLSEDEFSQPEMHNDGHCLLCRRADGCHVRSVAVQEPLRGAVVIRHVAGALRLARLGDQLMLRRGDIVEVGGDDVLSTVSRMIVDPTGGSEQVLDWEDVTAAWPAMDSDLDHRFRGLDFVHRWVAVGRVRVTGVRVGDVVRPLAFDLRGPGILMPRVLARFGACQIGLAHDWLLWQAQELHGGSARAQLHVGSDVEAVAEWLRQECLAHLAAMFIEPLDPEGVFTMLERQRYYDHLIGVLGDARIGVCADALRSALLGSDDYLRAQAAMADPRSDEDFWNAMASHGARLGLREVFRLNLP